MVKNADAKITRSSGNIFKDLGYSREEAEHLRIRSALMVIVSEVIETRGLTQVQAAKLLGVSQPRISDLVRGKIGLFSIDTLVDMLASADVRVELSVAGSHKPRKNPFGIWKSKKIDALAYEDELRGE